MVTGNKLNDVFSLVTNWGITWVGNNSSAKSFYAVNTSFSITDKLGGFVEVYGSFNEFDKNFDTGLGYQVNNDVLLDISTGWQGQDGVGD